MRKLLLFSLATATLVGCSNTEDGIDTAYNGEIETNYLSVNLVTSFGGTRADNPDNDDFEIGTQEEGKVNSVRFYFYTATGDVANVKKSGDSFVNYYDWTYEDSDNNYGSQENNNVENVINATLVMESPKGDLIAKNNPSTVIAVINPDAKLLAKTQSLTKEALTSAAEDYTSHANGFVMSNTVYADPADGKAMIEVSTENHVYPTRDAAKGDPVAIYVERVLAKVRMNAAAALEGAADNLYDTGQTYTDVDGEEHKIYMKILNWDLTAIPDKSYLVKNIDTSWAEDLFGYSEPWNDPARHRSYWALNPTVTYSYLSFSDIVPDNTTAKDIFAASNNVRYPQENAGEITDAAFTPTKVVLAAMLCDENGEALTLAEYGFDRYAGATAEDVQKTLKTKLLSLLSTKYYIEDTAGTVTAGDKKYRQIGLNDVEFVTEGSLVNGENGGSQNATCYTQLQLTATSKVATWYTISNGVATAIGNGNQAINADLIALGHQKIWNGGLSYFYFDVEHLGKVSFNDAQINRPGIVRNHVYNITISKLLGLGTPVYDPDEEIIPQKPSDDETYVAAEIKVLTWRLINQNVEIDW